MAKITQIEGIGDSTAAKLAEAGIKSAEGLLKMGASADGRKEIAAKSGVDVKTILKWVNNADLFRVKGIGEEYAELLEIAGVDTVPELGQRNAENLYKKLLEVNEATSLVRRPPTLKEVESWVAQAKDLPRVINY